MLCFTCTLVYHAVCFTCTSVHLLQWNQECLAYLLRIIMQFSVEHQDMESMKEDADAQESPRRKLRRLRGLEEKVLIPRVMQVGTVARLFSGQFLPLCGNSYFLLCVETVTAFFV